MYTPPYLCMHHRIQLADGDMILRGRKPILSLISTIYSKDFSSVPWPTNLIYIVLAPGFFETDLISPSIYFDSENIVNTIFSELCIQLKRHESELHMRLFPKAWLYQSWQFNTQTRLLTKRRHQSNHTVRHKKNPIVYTIFCPKYQDSA